MTQVLDKLSDKTQSQGSGQSEAAHMTQLKAKLSEKVQAHRPRTAKLTKEYADVVIDKVDIGQCIGGARDIRCLVTTSPTSIRRKGYASGARPSRKPLRPFPRLPAPFSDRRVLLVFPPDRRRFPPRPRWTRSLHSGSRARKFPSTCLTCSAPARESHPM